LTIRGIKAGDIDAILAIQRASPEIAQWAPGDYSRAAAGEMAGWVAEEKGQIAGFLVARRIASDLEVLNFAVRADARQKGVGALLVGKVLDWARTFAAQKVFLEVRCSNLIAQRFYKRHAFKVTGRRLRYYSGPIEDALVLARTLT
jgi:[ribosomal protein S18]-alanine N-acetyltransferase